MKITERLETLAKEYGALMDESKFAKVNIISEKTFQLNKDLRLDKKR